MGLMVLVQMKEMLAFQIFCSHSCYSKTSQILLLYKFYYLIFLVPSLFLFCLEMLILEPVVSLKEHPGVGLFQTRGQCFQSFCLEQIGVQ